MIVREFNFEKDSLEQLWTLHETVYQGSQGLRERWCWEVEQYPRGSVRIFVAESDDRFIGMTMRMPFTLRVEGVDVTGCFATNSMVLKEYRGRGLIQELYSYAEKVADIQLSKGTSPAMYAKLMDMGYREILPNNYLTCIVSPLAWITWKITGRVYKKSASNSKKIAFSEYELVDDLESFDGFESSYCSSIVQEKKYFKWRYFDLPHKKYFVYERKCQGKVVSRSAIRFEGHTTFLVDMRWDKSMKDEPRKTIKFIKHVSRSKNSIKIVAWCNLKSLRSALNKEYFFFSTDTPHFSYNSSFQKWKNINWDTTHITHGDGDLDYL